MSKILERVRQSMDYFTLEFSGEMDSFAKKNLSYSEYMVFSQMGRYDKIHCVKCAKAVLTQAAIFSEKKWVVAALLHDCGKPAGTGFFKRTVHALFKNVKQLRNHAERGYEMLKEINPEAAEIVRVHHLKDVPDEIKSFQEIDDKN